MWFDTNENVTSVFMYHFPTGMLVKIIGGDRIHSPNLDEYFNVTATVKKIYKRRGIRRFNGFVNFFTCDLPDRAINKKHGGARRNTKLLIMGYVKDDYGLVVDDNGYLEIQGRDSKRKGRACQPQLIG